jgi:surface-anchored protein
MRHSYLLALALSLQVFTASAQPYDIILGHYEVHIDYQPSPGNADAGWAFSVSFDDDNDFFDNDGITRLEPSLTRLVAAPNTQLNITSAISQLGGVGEPIWVLPQNNRLDTLYLGLRTVISPGIFQTTFNGAFQPFPPGSIVLELIEVTGSGVDNGGNFALWESRSIGNPEVHFDSSDGLNAEDRLSSVPVGAHVHYNWAMTKPGSYHATFGASGRLMSGQNTSSEATFTFVVPYSGSISGAAQLRLCDHKELPASVYSSAESCEYSPNRVALTTEPTTCGSTDSVYGFSLQAVVDAEASVNRIGIDQVQPVKLSEGVGFKALDLESYAGPGDVTLMSGCQGSYLLSMSEPGIYRVWLRAKLTEQGGSEFTAEAFQLVVLAGLPVDYDYASYAESYEHQHGLTAGALGDAFADFDNDGVVNGLEYQLFWHGFDPAVADAHLLPQPSMVNGTWGVTFVRDTYKDDYSESATSLSASISPDLASWYSWHSRGATMPGQIGFESGTGAESIGYIMARRIELGETAGMGFFRFSLF